MADTHVVPGFLPSTHGLHFANSFPPGPTIRLGPLDPRLIGLGDASMGLCGGMCYFVRRRFETAQPVPEAATVPENGSELFRSLVREQLRSFRVGVVPMRFWRLAATTAAKRLARTRDREWPKIRAALDGDRLTMVGLVRHEARNPFKLIGNHQVVAYGYVVDDGSITLRIYDPNWPNRDDVTVPLDGSGPQSTGEVLLGVVALD